jgi:hypothetical protein
VNTTAFTLPNGTEITFNSKRVYTHAVAICEKGEWGIVSTHTSEALAVKSSRRWEKPLQNPIDGYRIIAAN